MADIIEQEPRDYLNPELPLLLREGLRRRRDRTFRTWILSVLDSGLGLGHWWFPRLLYERRHSEDGLVWHRSEIRKTLAGYFILWGVMIEYYEDGTMMSHEIIWGSPFASGYQRGKGTYWLPGCVKASKRDWLSYQLGQEMTDEVMKFVGED